VDERSHCPSHQNLEADISVEEDSYCAMARPSEKRPCRSGSECDQHASSYRTLSQRVLDEDPFAWAGKVAEETHREQRINSTARLRIPVDAHGKKRLTSRLFPSLQSHLHICTNPSAAI
jgi:hypothetical protein